LIPVPNPAKIARSVDVAEIADAFFGEIIARLDPAPAGAQNDCIDIFIERIAGCNYLMRINGIIRRNTARQPNSLAGGTIVVWQVISTPRFG
jgi:hypothetical protein